MHRDYTIALLVVFLSAPPLVCQQHTATSYSVVGLPYDGINGAMVGTASSIPLALVTKQQQPVQIWSGTAGKVLEILPIGQIHSTGSLHLLPQPMGSIQVNLASTNNTAALVVTGAGNSGTESAAIVLSSSANGTGVALRIGGPAGGLRPTFATGLDLTGGTGIRYNALVASSGTALEIGKTTAPNRGIEIVASGANHVGVYARSNTNGSGVIGVSMSSAYSDPPVLERIGVRGHSASNSTIATDTLFGIVGTAQRGGTGGTQTTSIGVLGKAMSIGTSHAGMSIGVIGTAQATAPGKATAIGVLGLGDVLSMALVSLGGDVFLGSSAAFKPAALSAVAPWLPTTSTVSMFNSNVSGSMRFLSTSSTTSLSDSAGFSVSITTIPTSNASGTVLRITANGESATYSSGHPNNTATEAGALVLGGGRELAPNRSIQPYSIVLGGAGNVADAPYSVVLNGSHNVIHGQESAIVAGHDVTINAPNVLAVGYATTLSTRNSVVFFHNDPNPNNYTKCGINVANPESQLDIYGTVAVRQGQQVVLPAGQSNDVLVGVSSVVPVVADNIESVVTGFAPISPGRMLTIVVRAGNVTIANNNMASLPEHRIITGLGNNLVLQGESSLQLWYDSETGCWRVVSFVP
jgi:hypothetical protein